MEWKRRTGARLHHQTRSLTDAIRPSDEPNYVGRDSDALISDARARAGPSRSLERAKVAGFTQPYLEFSTVPVVLRKNAERFKNWPDIDQTGVTVATTLGTVFDGQAREFFKVATLRQVEAPAAGYQEVLSGRADVTITSNVDAAALIRRYPELAIVAVDHPRAPRPASFLVSQNDQVWLNYLNNWITIKRMLGFFDKLDKKWLRGDD
jgi:cyclohexadienyl dehydratase